MGYVECKHRDWFDEIDSNISKLLEAKRRKYLKYLGAYEKERAVLLRSFKSAMLLLQRNVLRMKNR